ncbi:MAG: sigma-70 family RNA polymerase sigma factor [Pirellula sp.]
MTAEQIDSTEFGDSSKSHVQPDREWLHAVFQRLERPLVAYATRLLNGNLESARDCVQETFLKLCRESRSNVEGHVDAWLFRTCRNHAMDLHRREARMTIDSESSALATATAMDLGPAAQLLQHDERQLLRQQIDRLPKREQEVLELRLGQGLTYKQIADIMQLSVSNVGVLLHQAVTRLRTSMNGLEKSLHAKPYYSAEWR